MQGAPTWQNQITQGTGQAGNINDQSTAQTNETASQGGGGMGGMQQAIANKSNKNFSTQQAKMQQNAQFQGQVMANNNYNTAAANAIALQNAQNGVDSSILQYSLQANAARYGTISSLMSGAGSLAGAYAGSSSSGTSNGTQQDGNTNPASVYGTAGSNAWASDPSGQNNMGSYGQSTWGNGSQNNSMGSYGQSSGQNY